MSMFEPYDYIGLIVSRSVKHGRLEATNDVEWLIIKYKDTIYKY